MAIIKVKDRVINNELGTKITISGIKITIVSNVDISFNETDFYRSLYINFISDNGKIYSERNTANV